MKQGKSIVELAEELQRRQNAKTDFIADTREVFFDSFAPSVDGGDTPPASKVPTLVVQGNPYPILQTAHRQIGERTGIPARYYDRMKDEAPELLGMNVNHWFKKHPERRMVRTLDGNARAFLSDRYQRIDNEHIAEAILPVLLNTDGIKIASCEVTERRLYIKAVNERLRDEVRKDDVVEAGVMITNSEIGFGAACVTPIVHRLWCLNGCVINDARFRKAHVGAQADTSESVYAMLSDETLAADDNAIMLKMRDVVKASLEQAFFAQQVNKFREAAEGEKIAKPVEAVEVLAKSHQLNETEKNGVLTSLIENGDLTRYGLLNAVTATAQTVESYDRSTELEELGGKLLELNRSEWHAYAEAA